MCYSIDLVLKLYLMTFFIDHSTIYGKVNPTFLFLSAVLAMRKWNLVEGNQMLFFYVRQGFNVEC